MKSLPWLKREPPEPTGGVAAPEKVGYLSKMDLFRDFTKEDMRWLDSVTVMMTTEKGKIIYTPGETGEVLFLLKKGKVQIYRLSPEGKKLVMSTLGEDTFFGEMSILGQGMYDSFAEALENCTICAMSRSDVERLLVSKPIVALRVLNVVGNRLKNAEEALENLAFKNVSGRTASLLLRLVEGHRDGVISGLTHQDMAEMIGTFRETMTQTLNDLKSTGLINIGRMKITVLDVEGLRRIAEL